MGGMQTFQWIVSYPEFMDTAVPIVGSPRLAPYDLLLWQAQIDAIVNDPAWNNGEYPKNPARAAEYEFSALLLTTPEHFNRTMSREGVLTAIEKGKAEAGFDANDKIRQVQSMMALDVASGFGGSLERAAQAVKARVLVIIAKSDHVVTPGPAIQFARLLNAGLVELESDCGHLAALCLSKQVNETVSSFLQK